MNERTNELSSSSVSVSGPAEAMDSDESGRSVGHDGEHSGCRRRAAFVGKVNACLPAGRSVTDDPAPRRAAVGARAMPAAMGAEPLTFWTKAGKVKQGMDRDT